MKVSLTKASESDLHIVKNFFVGYFYDMSQYDDKLIINEHGLPMWEPFGLPGPVNIEECALFNWWIRDRCEAYIIRADESPAGFIFVCADKTVLAPEIDFELMDFYVAPRYRRNHVGRQAALQTFELHHGAWQVFQLARNAPARVFWQAVIAEYTGGQFQNLDDGTQQRFSN